ncbi:1-acyl-sn-glycerol-3-phosphate acyltransferase [Thalassolituus pacificus]|uniref:1-acyl-sn-glycerol-3-phosphate acyltransferase n=1 Tax=Thalassolituus pacificus TaxID=2975440 RepID=A0A9X2WD49_9GAMM|nr:1-acyl-sn-glycerol-3-phosphate acyltransferase [Thalassolituus pacificus]MCT7357926.1 1-acyl-sn-glycerol-3-phosphate acyltransferase [Thalassolituus pacificus]
MQDQYSDIRPYHDEEVRRVIQRLTRARTLQHALVKYRFPALPAWLRQALLPLAGWYLRRRTAHIHTVESFQRWLAPWIASLLKQSSDDIVVRGLEHLSSEKSYLWISNHKDIAMDPTLINYSLHHAGWPTSRIAIGDNLLGHPDVADIMRLNKSFVVKRSVANKREKLRELQKLSAYIRTSLESGHSIWIAQREGRAKDGIDRTDTAVLKMLALNGRERGENFTATMTAMRPVPVSIQYEWDPCDVQKAQELVTRAETGRYEKSLDEDTRSILLGLTGAKGRIYVDFGHPLSAAELASADDMAQAIDLQLQQMCEILPVQQSALYLLQQEYSLATEYDCSGVDTVTHKKLLRRLEGLDHAVRQRLLQTYAAPLLQKVAAENAEQQQSGSIE